MSAQDFAVDPDEPLWTALDVSRFLQVSRSWVYLHAEDGTLPSVKVGGLRRFVPSQVKAWAVGEKPPRLASFTLKGR